MFGKRVTLNVKIKHVDSSDYIKLLTSTEAKKKIYS